MKGGNYNPEGRPRELVEPVKVSVILEAEVVKGLDKLQADMQWCHGKSKKITRAHTIRYLLKEQLKAQLFLNPSIELI